MNICMSTKEASLYIGMSVQWLKQARCNGVPMIKSGRQRIASPAYHKIGTRKVVYKQNDLDKWLESFRHE